MDNTKRGVLRTKNEIIIFDQITETKGYTHPDGIKFTQIVKQERDDEVFIQNNHFIVQVKDDKGNILINPLYIPEVSYHIFGDGSGEMVIKVYDHKGLNLKNILNGEKFFVRIIMLSTVGSIMKQLKFESNCYGRIQQQLDWKSDNLAFAKLTFFLSKLLIDNDDK